MNKNTFLYKLCGESSLNLRNMIVHALGRHTSYSKHQKRFATVNSQTKLSLVPVSASGNSTDSNNLSNATTLTGLQNKHTYCLSPSTVNKAKTLFAVQSVMSCFKHGVSSLNLRNIIVHNLKRYMSYFKHQKRFATVISPTKLSLVPVSVNGNSTDSNNLSNAATLTGLQNRHMFSNCPSPSTVIKVRTFFVVQSVMFHFKHDSVNYPPELLRMMFPNSEITSKISLVELNLGIL